MGEKGVKNMIKKIQRQGLVGKVMAEPDLNDPSPLTNFGVVEIEGSLGEENGWENRLYASAHLDPRGFYTVNPAIGKTWVIQVSSHKKGFDPLRRSLDFHEIYMPSLSAFAQKLEVSPEFVPMVEILTEIVESYRADMPARSGNEP